MAGADDLIKKGIKTGLGAIFGKAEEEAAKALKERAFQELLRAPNAQIRPDLFLNPQMKGDGRKFEGFFGDVTSGKSDVYKPRGLENYKPAIELGPEEAAFRILRDLYSGNFDQHIKTSIPGFDEVQNAVGTSLVRTFGNRPGTRMLDIGSSEGALIKAIADKSGGNIQTHGIDPNLDMIRTFQSKPQVPGATTELAAFGPRSSQGEVAWVADDGTPVRYFNPQNPYDIAHEAMVFQFIDNQRPAQLQRVKELMSPSGLLVSEEKLGNPKSIYDANEARKDLYKSQYYTPEQMETKRKEVLQTGGDQVEGMTDLQVTQAEMERALANLYGNRAQFWDSGNFKGYAASDDKAVLDEFLGNLQDLQSGYSTTLTPRRFAYGGDVGRKPNDVVANALRIAMEMTGNKRAA